MKYEIRTKLETATNIIMACALLHNIAVDLRLPDVQDDDDDDEEDDEDDSDDDDDDDLEQIRRREDGRAARENAAMQFFR